jgi:hypothetical protein
MSMFDRNLTIYWSGTEVNAIVDSKFTSVRSILPLYVIDTPNQSIEIILVRSQISSKTNRLRL